MFPVDAPAIELYARAAQAAAGRIGLYAALPGDVETLAARTGTRPRRLAALLDALCLDGTLRRQADGFALGRRSETTPALPPSGWGLLGEVLLGDRPLAGPADDRSFQEHLYRANAAPAAELWRRLPADGPLLDLGGGLGAFTAAFLAARPGAAATLLDRPSVVTRARAGAAALVAADLFQDELGSGYRTVLLANVLHLYPAEDCRRLLRRAASATAEGGRLVVVDLAIAPDRSGPPAAVYFALNMALYTEGGTVHGLADLTAWLAQATFGTPVVETLESAPDVVAIIAQGRSS